MTWLNTLHGGWQRHWRSLALSFPVLEHVHCLEELLCRMYTMDMGCVNICDFEFEALACMIDTLCMFARLIGSSSQIGHMRCWHIGWWYPAWCIDNLVRCWLRLLCWTLAWAWEGSLNMRWASLVWASIVTCLLPTLFPEVQSSFCLWRCHSLSMYWHRKGCFLWP